MCSVDWQHINWGQFTVLTTKGHLPNKYKWEAPPGTFRAESCARHVYASVEPNLLNNIPPQIKTDSATKFLQGKDAYLFFVKFYAGLEGFRIVEQHDTNQIDTCWQEFYGNQPNSHLPLKPYITEMMRDARTIAGKILKPFRSNPTPINIAVRLANLAPDKQALIVCGSKDFSSEIIAALGHKKKHTPDTLYLTHPDKTTLDEITCSLKHLPKQRALQAECKSVSINSALTDILPTVDAVFICQPMTDNPAGESPELAALNNKITGMWKQRRGQQTGKILHLKGNPFCWETTIGPWATLTADDGFIPFSFLKTQAEHEKARRITVQQTATHIILEIADLRFAGHKVNGIKIKQGSPDQPEGFEYEYIIARPPLGHDAVGNQRGLTVNNATAGFSEQYIPC